MSLRRTARCLACDDQWPEGAQDADRRLLVALPQRVVAHEALGEGAVGARRSAEHGRGEVVGVDDDELDAAAGGVAEDVGEVGRDAVRICGPQLGVRVVRRQRVPGGTVDGLHVGAGHLVEEAALADHLARRRDGRGGDDARRAGLVDGELHGLRDAEADAVRRLGHGLAEDLGQSGRVDLVQRIAAALAGGDRLLGHDDEVAGPDVLRDLAAHELVQVVAAADEVGADRQTGEDGAAGDAEQVLLLVRRVPGQEALGLGGRSGARGRPKQRRHLRVAGRGDAAAVHGADGDGRAERRLHVGVHEHHARVDEFAQPQLDVGGAPEEHALLDLAAAAGAERAHHRVAVPVRPRLERRRLVEARERRAARLDPAHLRRREPDLPAAEADLLGQRALERRAQDPAAPAVPHDGVLRQAEDVVDELLVEVRHPALDAERHRVAVLVAEQAREAVGEQILEKALLELRLGAPVPRVRGPGEEVLSEEPARRQLLAPLLDAPLGQRHEHVARGRGLPAQQVVLALSAQLAQIDELVWHVAGDQLVPALAVEQHGDLLARGAHHAPLRVGAGADDGLFLVPDEVAQLADELVRRRVGVGGVGARALDGDLDVLALVDGVAVEHGAEGLELAAQRGRVGRLLLEQLAHEADDRRRVEAAGEAGADRDLGDEAPLDALAEAAPEVRRVVAAVCRQPRRPVRGALERGGERAGRRGGVAQRQLDPGRRRHVVDALEERLGAVVVEAVLQVLEDHLLVRLGDELGVLEQCLDLAAEEQPAAPGRACVVERLDAEVVAVQHELAAAPVLIGAAQIGHGEGPHAIEARGAGGAPLLVGVDDDLGVTVRAEDVAGGLELGAQLAVVVDLAVVDEPDGLVLVGDRLVSALAVDDAQAAVAEADGRRLEGAGVIGAAVHDGGGHTPEKLPVGRAGEAEDAAHKRKLSWGLGPLTARRLCRAPRRTTLPQAAGGSDRRTGPGHAGARTWQAAPPQADHATSGRRCPVRHISFERFPGWDMQ